MTSGRNNGSPRRRPGKCRLVQRDQTVGKAQEAVVEPEKASDTLGLTLPDEAGGWCVQRDEQRKHLAAKALMERKVTADCDNLVVGMRSHH